MIKTPHPGRRFPGLLPVFLLALLTTACTASSAAPLLPVNSAVPASPAANPAGVDPELRANAPAPAALPPSSPVPVPAPAAVNPAPAATGTADGSPAILPAPGLAAPGATVAVPTATVSPTAGRLSSPTAIPVPPALSPGPTPHPGNSPWVRQRLETVINLYNLTEAGAALLYSVEVRQMLGEPGYFGSYGFHGWAGVGEAKPNPVMHELSHSYWGGFPVAGRPDLSWEIPAGEKVSPALQSYHDAALTFMAQPPDDYELLRQRWRNLPELSAANLEPLLHSAEADLIYDTGGHLALVPPILRPYWLYLLRDGPFPDWYAAAAWYQSLPPEQRRTAGQYLGYTHLDLRGYAALPPYEPAADLLASPRRWLNREERQRLFDFAAQFDLLLGDPEKETNFWFWRSYLRDKLDLYRRHPGYLQSLTLPRAGQVDAALSTLTAVAGQSPEWQAEYIAARLPEQPFLVNFLPALDNPVLLELFARDTPLLPGTTLAATAAFVEHLNRFDQVMRPTLTAGQRDAAAGAVELRRFLEEQNYGPPEDVRLFLDLLRDADRDTARRVVMALETDAFRRLLTVAPAQIRAILPPADLLPRLEVTAAADTLALQRGIALLVAEASGNYRIDELYLQGLYQVIADRTQREPAATLAILLDSPVPLGGFLREQPAAAAWALSIYPAAAAQLIRDSDPVLLPPPAAIYRLIYADPALAADLTIILDAMEEDKIVREALAWFAYDKSRAERLPDLPISLQGDGQYLAALLERGGRPWLAQRLQQARADFAQRAARGEVAADFPAQYQATLQAAVATLPEGDAKAVLRELIGD